MAEDNHHQSLTVKSTDACFFVAKDAILLLVCRK